MLRRGQPFQKDLHRTGQLRYWIKIAWIEDQGGRDQGVQIKPPAPTLSGETWPAILRQAPAGIEGLSPKRYRQPAQQRLKP